MLTLTCSSCQRKLAVKEDLAGKKIKCPGCGAVTAITAQTAVAAHVGKEDGPQTPPLPPPSDASEQPTNPPSNQPDATVGVQPDCVPEARLTDFLAPAQAADELGRLGKYRILKILGHGGMGVVFKAEDPLLKRTVAIKAMLPTLAASPSSAKRFIREAQAMAAVEHDHIVRIYDTLEERGIPFMAMEFLKGEPLDDRLKRGEPVPLADILRIGREIAEGLGAAHATGLIHRDIKPGNIWLEDRNTSRTRQEAGSAAPLPDGRGSLGRVKILDFGLARAATSKDAGLTQQGAIVGTPAYMAPEQARGGAVDARCDLFSLGVVLYRMCTGQAPFHGPDSVSTLMAVAMNEPPPPIQINKDLPPELSDLVMKLLAKDPAARLGSAAEVVQAVQAIETKIALAKMQTERTETLNTGDLKRGFSARPRIQGPSPFELPPEVTLPSLPRKTVTAMDAKAGRTRTTLFAIAGALFFLIGLGGVIYYLQTDHGIVRVEINDPKIKVAIEGDEFTFTNVDKKDIRMKPGKHGLSITRDDFTFDTANFELKRGETVTLKIDWLKAGKLVVTQDERVIGMKDFAKVKPPPEKTPKAEQAPAAAVWSLAFDGNSRVSLPALALNVDEPLTVEAWVTPRVQSSKIDPTLFEVGWIHQGINLGKKKWQIHLPQSDPKRKDTYRLFWSDQEYSPGMRTHLAAVWTGKEIFSYVNGQMQGGHDRVIVGKEINRLPFLGVDFQGQIHRFRVSKAQRFRGLTSPIDERFDNDDKTLILYRFEEGQGDVLKDSSGNKNHGTIVGARWVQVEGPPLASPGGEPPLVAGLKADQRVYALGFTPEGLLVSGGWGAIKVFDLAQPAAQKDLAQNIAIRGLAISRDGKTLFYSGMDRNRQDEWVVRAIDRITGNVVQTFPTEGGGLNVALSPDEKTLAYHLKNGGDSKPALVQLADAKTGAKGLAGEVCSWYPHGLKFSADGSRLAVVNHGQLLRILDTKTMQDAAKRVSLGGIFDWVDVTADGLIAVPDARENGKAFGWCLYDLKAKLVYRETQQPTRPVTGTLSPDGQRLAIGGEDGCIYLWSIRDKKELLGKWSAFKMRVKDGPMPIRAVAFSCDGRLLAAAGDAGIIKVWDVAKSGPAASGRRTLNLLEIIDAKKDATKGEWSTVADGLKSPKNDIGVAEFPYTPPDEYDFRIEFTCFSGAAQINQFLARRDRSFSYVTFAAGGTSGLEMIAGVSASENKTSAKRLPFELNKRHVLIARIRNSQVTVEVDGTEVVRWKTDYSDLALDHEKHEHWVKARRNRALLAVGTNNSEVIFHKAQVVEITGQGKFLRPDDPAVRAGKWKVEPGPWQPLLNGADLKGWSTFTKVAKAKANLVAEDGNPVLRLIAPIAIQTNAAFRDFHLRFEHNAQNKSGSGVNIAPDLAVQLRFHFDPLGKANGVEFEGRDITCQDADFVAGRFLPRGDKLGSKNFKLAAGTLDPATTWQRIEIIRLGDSCLFLVNGKVVRAITNLRAVPKDKEQPIGPMPIMFWADWPGKWAHFRNIEIRDINALPPELLANAPFPLLDPAWLKAVAAMKAEQQIEALKAELMKRNPGFDGNPTPAFGKDGVVTGLGFVTDKVADIAPVRALKGLHSLQCNGASGKSPLVDLAPLADLPLTPLVFYNTKVMDLTPLKGMKLTYLRCDNIAAGYHAKSPYGPLQGMPLVELRCNFSAERDAAILRAIPTLQTINGQAAKELLK